MPTLKKSCIENNITIKYHEAKKETYLSYVSLVAAFGKWGGGAKPFILSKKRFKQTNSKIISPIKVILFFCSLVKFLGTAVGM